MELTQKIVIGIITIASIYITFTHGSCCPGRDNKKEKKLTQEELLKILMDRLHEYIEENGVKDLTFTITVGLMDDLFYTSEKLKVSFVKHAAELEKTEPNNEKNPVTALKLSIDDTFDYYTMRLTKRVKAEAEKCKSMIAFIKRHDPIGLSVYITHVMDDDSKKYGTYKHGGTNDMFRLRKFVNLFHETLKFRLALREKQTREYAIELDIPYESLVEITTERMDISDDAIYRFMLIVNKRTNYKMHEIWKYQLNNEYEPHTDVNANDVQILFGVEDDVKGYGHGHYICTQYSAAEKKILIYDSKGFGEIGESQKKILYENLYLFKPPPPIKFVQLKFFQWDVTSCGLYAIAYATALIIGGDNPKNIEYKVNDVYGDESLYMRLHLLTILKERKLKIFPRAG